MICYDIDGYVPCYSILTVICWGFSPDRIIGIPWKKSYGPTGGLSPSQEFLVICRVSIDIDVDIIHIYIYTFIYLFIYIYIFVYLNPPPVHYFSPLAKGTKFQPLKLISAP